MSNFFNAVVLSLGVLAIESVLVRALLEYVLSLELEYLKVVALVLLSRILFNGLAVKLDLLRKEKKEENEGDLNEAA